MLITAATDTTIDPPVWFRTDVDGTTNTITIEGDHVLVSGGADVSFDVQGSVQILAAVITPEPPAGTIILSYTTALVTSLTLSLSIPSIAAIGDPGFEVLGITYRMPDGTLATVISFADIPAAAEQIVSYTTGAQTVKYTLTLTVREVPVAGPESTTTAAFRFGAEPNYSPNRDALLAAVDARR